MTKREGTESARPRHRACRPEEIVPHCRAMLDRERVLVAIPINGARHCRSASLRAAVFHFDGLPDALPIDKEEVCVESSAAAAASF